MLRTILKKGGSDPCEVKVCRATTFECDSGSCNYSKVYKDFICSPKCSTECPPSNHVDVTQRIQHCKKDDKDDKDNKGNKDNKDNL
jgi:hypothetical protein